MCFIFLHIRCIRCMCSYFISEDQFLHELLLNTYWVYALYFTLVHISFNLRSSYNAFRSNIIVFLLIHPVQNSQLQISIQHYKSQHNSFRTPQQKKLHCIDHVFYVISGAIYQYNLYNFIRLHVEIKCTDFFVCSSCVQFEVLFYH